jgi:hypothetical protein
MTIKVSVFRWEGCDYLEGGFSAADLLMTTVLHGSSDGDIRQEHARIKLGARAFAELMHSCG